MHTVADCDEKKTDSPPEGLAARLVKARTIVISGQIDQEVAERVISQLMILDTEPAEPIKLIITSQGGHVDSGLAIHDMMRFIQSKVIAIAAGWCASIAVPILMGAAKGNRLSLPNTRFLLHQPSGGAGGQLSDIRIQAEQMLKIRERLNKMLADETGQSVERIQKDSDRDFWMTADEALEYGIINRIVTSAAEV
jgi:ATP-dependent Clp protease protease subunit